MLTSHAVGQGASFAASAKAAAQAAIALDPDLAEGWALFGAATLLADRDFAGADAALLKALALDSGLARAHRARAFALAATGRFVEAERAARRAVDIDPLAVAAHVDVIQILFAARRCQALAEAKKAVQSSADRPKPGRARLERTPSSVRTATPPRRCSKASACSVPMRQPCPSQVGLRRERIRRVLFGGRRVFGQQRVMFVARPMDIAMMRANAGQADAAFAALEEALRRDDPALLFLAYLPHLDRLRNDPRFASIQSQARLVR